MCLAQSTDRLVGRFEEQAALAAATVYKQHGRATRAAKLVTITSV